MHFVIPLVKTNKMTESSGWRRAAALPGQSGDSLSYFQPRQHGESLKLVDIGALTTIGSVLAYAVFEWGGVVRTDQYRYLLVLGLLAMVLSLARPRHHWAPLPDRVVRTALALLPAYILMQVAPLPVALLRVLSPVRAEAVAALDRVGAKVNFASLSASPAATFQSFLLVCGYVLIFLLTRELTWRFDDRRWLAIWPIVAIGALEAGLGLCQNFGKGVDQIRWGTYVNHNHYAGFLEMALPFAVVYPVALWQRTHAPGRSPVAPALAACGVCALAGLIFAAIVFSFSRMGFIATLSSLFVMGALAFGIRQLSWAVRSRKRQVGTVSLVAALVLAAFVFLPPDKLIARFAQIATVEGLTAEGRINLWAETIPLIRAYPVVGCGLGGYEAAFMRFKTFDPLVTDDFAHNDYLQMLAELGLVGFAIGAALAFSVLRTAVRKAVESPDPGRRYFAVACAGALAAILVHSLADFNLYIPANAMLLAWIAGMAAGL